MQSASSYEVRCPHCQVSFPPDQKRCVHCGGRTGPSFREVADAPPDLRDADPSLSASEAQAKASSEDREFVFEDEEVEAAGRPRGGLLRMAGTLVWVVLAVGIGLIRSCADKS